MRKPTLIDNWKSAYRWVSVQIMALSGIVLTAWAAIPATFHQFIPPSAMKVILAIILFAGIGGRLINQSTPQKKRKKANNTKGKSKIKASDKIAQGSA